MTAWNWLEEVLEGELALLESSRRLLGLLLVEHRLRLLDEGEDVPHAQDPAGHPLGVERLEIVETLADAGELDRGTGHLPHRDGGPATGVAVELGEHDAADPDLALEALGDVDRILAGHGVDHEQHLVGIGRLSHRRQLLHQRLVDLETTCGVDDDHVVARCWPPP